MFFLFYIKEASEIWNTENFWREGGVMKPGLYPIIMWKLMNLFDTLLNWK